MTQVILGAGGDIGILLAKALKDYTSNIRLVCRNPRQVNGDDQLLKADLLHAQQVHRALEGAHVAYLTAGLSYDLRIWKKDWPRIIKHVIEACLAQQVKLVFFDNVYLYDQAQMGHMQENTRHDPPSQKGLLRQQLIQALEEARIQRGLEVLIARSADFYGPGSNNGILNMLVLNALQEGKKPLWQCRTDRIHSFTYTPDAAKACALLGNTPKAYNQVWHLPTSDEKWTGADYISYASKLKGKPPKCFILKPWMFRLGGVFNRRIRELSEMQYQNDRDYFFDSQKFNRTFNFTPTPYREGIQSVLNLD